MAQRRRVVRLAHSDEVKRIGEREIVYEGLLLCRVEIRHAASQDFFVDLFSTAECGGFFVYLVCKLFLCPHFEHVDASLISR